MESVLAPSKSSQKTKLIKGATLVLLLAFFAGCKSTPPVEENTSPVIAEKKTEPAPVAKEESKEKPTDWSKAITKLGKNEKPSFSSDGKRMLFISRERPAHKNRQLYEMNMDTKQERRITYQDGEVFEGFLSPDDQSIFYTSTTDEIKERPILFYPELKSEPFPMTEIYRIKPKDDQHERWTQRPGFDGFIHAHNEAGKGLTVTQSRWVGSDLQLYRSFGQKPGFEDFGQKKPGQWVHSFTTHTKKPWKAWIQENSITGATAIVFQKPGSAKQTINLATFEVRDLQFIEAASSKANPETIEFIYTGKTEKIGSRKAFWVNLAEKCQTPFMKSASEVSSLQVTPDGLNLAWTLSQGTESQIFMGILDKGPAKCEPLANDEDKSVAYHQ